MDLDRYKSEIILFLEENGYAQKEIKVKNYKINLFVKIGCLHMIGFPDDNSLDSLFVYYIIGGNLFSTQLIISIKEMNKISSVNRFIYLILEALIEIEKDFEKEVNKDSDIVPYSVYEYTYALYGWPLATFSLEFTCKSVINIIKTYRFCICYENSSIVLTKCIDSKHSGTIYSCEV